MSEFGFAATATDFMTVQETLVSQFTIEASDTDVYRRVPAAGEIINDLYRIESVVGVRKFVAVHRVLGEKFEVRLLPYSPRSNEFAQIDAAVRTASLVGNNTLGVVSDLGFCEQFGTYAACEIVHGTSIAQRLESEQVSSVDEVMRLALEIGGALGSLHEVGVAHGLIDLDDVVKGPDGSWRLLGAGLPPRPDVVWQFRAPEVETYFDATAASDQWALAAILYQMLTGFPPRQKDIRAPGKRRADVSEQLDQAIMRALSHEPDDRWRQMETSLDALQSGFQVWRQPSMVPLDAREVSRLLKLHPDAKNDFSRISEQTRQSVVVRVGNLKDAKPSLGLAFRNVARLRREYRHNLSHGGIFVPTPTPPTANSEVAVTIGLPSADESVELLGVVTHTTGGDDVSPPGAGVVFDAASLERLQAFLRNAGVIRGLRAQDFVSQNVEFGKVDDLSAEELFIYSLVIGAVPVCHLRSECSAMPFDFEETLQALVDRGAVGVERSGDSQDGAQFRPSRPGSDPVATQLDFAPEETEFLLEQIEFHRERGAFLAALALVDRGLRHLPEEARLHHELAIIQARGLNDLAVAMEAARKAVELDPTRREYGEMLTFVEGLVERDAIRRIYQREFPVTEVHFVGWDSTRSCVWVLTRSRLQPDRVRLLGIDVVRDTILHSETIEDSSKVHVVWSPIANAGENPVFFRGARRPAAISDDGSRWAFDHHPETGEPGIVLAAVGGENIRVLSDGAQCPSAAYSPGGGEWLAWTEIDDDHNLVCIAACEDGDRQEVFRTASDVELFWSTRDKNLVVYEADSGVVWSISAEGDVVEQGMVAPGFTRVLADPERTTAAVLYDGDSTSVLWVDLPSGEHLASYSIEESLHHTALRSDGCMVARTRHGVLVADLSLQRHRQVPGIRLTPASLRGSHWAGSRPLVGMVVRPNVLELVSLKVDVLLS